MQETITLLERPHVVQTMIQLVPDRLLRLAEAVEVRLARIETARQLSHTGLDRAHRRHGVVDTRFGVRLIVRKDGERGVFSRLPRDGRRNRETLLVDVVRLRAGIETVRRQTVK